MAHDAIILAAGFGSRLAQLSRSKPLARVRGMSLIEIGVRQAIAAGARRIVVVTGHEADSVEAHLAEISRAVGVTIEPRRLNDWSKPNGWSVIEGARGLEGPFLLMMADHIFGDGILEKMAAQELSQCDVILAIDAPDNPLVDPDDATWVKRRSNGSIEQIGKEIADYDSVDCGAFLASPDLVRAIETAIDNGKAGSLSHGMQVLADKGRAGVCDITGSWWIDVDDPRAHALAEAEIAGHVSALCEAGADA